MNDLRLRITNCFSSVFPVLSEQEIAMATNASVGSWDSLASASLIAVIEEEFGIQVGPDDLECFVSFDLILDYVTRHERGDGQTS